VEAFPFGRTADVTVNSRTDYVARIRAGIRDKTELLHEVGAKLHFPYWVHPNWNGFNDWISDLSWLPQQRVLLLHEAVPHLPRKEMVI
jgi:aspartate/tyrosine/aromatic aminotransferase